MRIVDFLRSGTSNMELLAQPAYLNIELIL
jgi:hypothetical protein